MYGKEKDCEEKPYYSFKMDYKKKEKRNPYNYRYAQPTDEDEVFEQQFFWDIKDGLGGF